MTSIPHFEDLSIREIYKTLELNWQASEKLDGTFLEAGLDESGQFYSRRKNGEKIYDLNDWPDEIWANTYRKGHIAASCIIEALVVEKAISPGNHIGFEIIDCCRPNSIFYNFTESDSNAYQGAIVATQTNWTPVSSLFEVLETLSISSSVDIITTADGLNAERVTQQFKWSVKVNKPVGSSWIKNRLGQSAQQTKMVLDHFLALPSNVEGFSVLEVLEIKLTAKHPKTGDRKWNDLKKELSEEREKLRQGFNSLILLFKDAAIRVLAGETRSMLGSGSIKEGAVVQTPETLFKLVNRPAFSKLNNFTHRAKYAIVGGRRPKRPSFLSRTAHWPVEKRIDRLNNLLTRYERLRYIVSIDVCMNPGGGSDMIVYYSGDLHQRTLNMFYDTKKRIEDGR